MDRGEFRNASWVVKQRKSADSQAVDASSEK